MNFSALTSTLGISNGVLTNQQIHIITNKLTPNINEVLEYCYGNEPLVINRAQLLRIDENTKTIEIQGTSKFLGARDESGNENLEVRAIFRLDADENVQMTVKYAILDQIPGPNQWRFPDSFPGLPTVPNYGEPLLFNPDIQEVVQVMVVPLNNYGEFDFWFFDGYFIVASEPQRESEFEIDLSWGINFVSRIRPKGVLAVVKNLFDYNEELTMYGTIRLPLPHETPQALASKYPDSPVRFQYPWNVAEDFHKGIPGIFLQMDLEIDYRLANDKIEFKGNKFYMYTPISQEWVLPETNPQFVPIQGFTGEINLPEADISMDVVCPIHIGVDQLEIIGFFDGISLENISKLAGLTGSNDSPLGELPQTIQDVGDKLDKLALTGASIGIDYTNLSKIQITNTSFTVGMPELNLEIWEDHFELNNIFCHFELAYPFSPKTDPVHPRQLGVMVYGQIEVEGIPFNVYANKAEGFTFYAEMAERQDLPLKGILEKYAPQIPPPSDLSIDIFRVGISPGREYSMALALAQGPNPWKIPLGPVGLLVKDVSMGFTYPKGGPALGSVSGTINLNNYAQLSVTYDTPGDIVIRSLIPSIQFKQLLEVLVDQPFDIPDAFDFHFTNSSVLIQKQANNYTFQLGTHLEKFGSLGLQIQKVVGQKWGVAFGLNMTAGKPSELPGLSFLSNFENIFQLNKLLLVVSSIEAPAFQFPDMASFNNPNINAKKISLPSRSGLVAGVNIFAEWQLNTSDKKQNLLKEFLGLDPIMGVTLQVSKNPSEFSKLFLSYQTTINGLPLNCIFGGQIMDGSIGLFLTGSFQVEIQGQPKTFDVTLLFVTSGAFISATMKGSTPIDFEVFQLGNLALEVGINWSGIPSLGVTGTIATAAFQSSVAVFFDSTQPSKSLVAGSVSDLTLKDVFDTFTGNEVTSDFSDLTEVLDSIGVEGTRYFNIPADLADDLDNLKLDRVALACQTNGGLTIPTTQEQFLLVVNEKGKYWHLTDMVQMRHYALEKKGNHIEVSTEAQFYCAPQDTFIGSIRFAQGFYINGAINFLNFQALATIEVNPHRGVSIYTEMDKIVIGSETLFSIKSEEGDGGPMVSMATFQDNAREKEDFRPPHCFINGEINTLGLSKGAFVNVTKDGCEFSLEGNLIPGVEVNLNGHFDSLTNMSLGGGLKVGIGEIDLGELGKISIDTWVEANLSMGVNGDIIFAKVNLSFTLAGTTHNIVDFELDISTKALANIVEIVWEKVKQFFEDLFTNPEKWAEYVANGIVTGVEEVQKVLDDVFGLPEGTTKEIMNTYFPPCALTSALGSM